MTWEPYDSRGRPNTPKSNPKDVNQLAEPLRTRAKAMIADCPHTGELGVVSGLRDPGSQWDLRAGRVGVANVWNNSVQVYPTTAVPARWNGTEWVGGSRHQTGHALDFGGTQRAMDWMRANRAAYGLALTVRKEGWHVEADRRDVLTGLVHNNPTAVRPSTPEPPKEWTDMATEAEVKKAAQDAATAAVAPLLEILKRLDADYLQKGKGVRQTIATIDQRTDDLVTGKRPKPKG